MPDPYNPWATPIFPGDNAQQPYENYASPQIANILTHIAGALGRGFMAPGQALQSTTPLTSEQLVAPAHDMMGVMVGGVPMAERGAVGVMGGKLGNPFDAVAEKYPQLKIDGAPARSPNDYGTLSRIAVPEELRGQGLATKAMQDIATEADKAGMNLALTPSADWGASVPRLKEFYSRFGFVPNAGRNKDFATRETMIRPAKKSD